jgi:uncharacterized membrane protein
LDSALASLAAAQAAFVGGHFLLSHLPVRGALAGRMGENGFLGLYSVLMAVFLAWVVLAYRAAPSVPLWSLGAAGRWIPTVVMPFALAFVVLGLTSKNVTAVGGERHWNSPIRGVGTITRHPFLWGAGLWALAHLAANGDAASVLLFGGMAVLAFAGMRAIDHKRAVRLGADWETVTRRTSLIPFAAALAGRVRIDWAGIGWVRPVLAVALYVALMHGHRFLFGVSALPRG